MQTSSPKTVLILGANGRFGAAADQAFAAAGWRVLAQVRRAPTEPLPAGAEALALPLAETAAISERAAGAQVVIYAVNPAYWRWDEELLPLFRQGVAVARQLRAVFMLPGCVYNYGQGLPAWLDETTPQRPSTRKGEQRVLMEDELRALGSQGVSSVLVRAGDFFGAGAGSWLDQAIVKDIARGKLVYPGPLDLAHSWAYLPDLARAFVAVAQLPRVTGYRAMHFSGHTLTGHEFMGVLERAAHSLGLRPARGFRHGGMPWRLIRVAGLFSPLLRELARMSYLWRVPHGLRGRALEQLVGTLPGTPIEAALRQTLVDLGHAPQQPAAALQRALSSQA